MKKLALSLFLLATSVSAQDMEFGNETHNIQTNPSDAVVVKELTFQDKDCVIAIAHTTSRGVAISCQWFPKEGTLEWWYREATQVNIIHLLTTSPVVDLLKEIWER